MFKINYIVIPGIVIFLIGLQMAMISMSDSWAWFESLNFPQSMPTYTQYGYILSVVFSLATLSALFAYNVDHNFTSVALFFLIGLLNCIWTYFFFVKHFLLVSGLLVAAIQFSLGLLLFLLFSQSLPAFFLLFPYFVWGFYDTYWSFIVWILN